MTDPILYHQYTSVKGGSDEGAAIDAAVLAHLLKECQSVIVCSNNTVSISPVLWGVLYGISDPDGKQLTTTEDKETKTKKIVTYANVNASVVPEVRFMNTVGTSLIQRSVVHFEWKADPAWYLLTVMDENKLTVDCVILDTLKVYGELKRCLKQCVASVQRFIVIQGTSTENWKHGEVVATTDSDVIALAAKHNLSVMDIARGMESAIQEFLVEHAALWYMYSRRRHANGLVILAKHH
jgi:hypothetical protein